MNSERMRVAIDGRALQPGFREHQGRGIGVYAVELVRALARRGDLELTLWHQPELPLPAEHVPAGVRVRAYPRLNVPRRDRIAMLTTVPASVRGSDHDLFHFLSHTDAPAWHCRGVVITVHDLILEMMASLYSARRPIEFRVFRALERRALSHAESVVTDSAVTRQDVVTRHRREAATVHVAHLGLHPRFVPPPPEVLAELRARLGLERAFVLYLGGIDARKNAAGLLRAYARLVAELDDAPDLVIAGRVREAVEYPALAALARGLGIESRLRLPGFVPDQDLPALHGAARVFAFPSLYEGFGFPPLEAMACGTPVVSSGGGSLAEVLGDGALVVPAGDEGALADGLRRTLAEEPLRRELRARGLANAARFTWERTAEATVVAYRDAMTRRRSAR
ncbi:MAG: glycosyltransferase family 4 protein [Candidatus Eisenbacteria bacterium]|uniref:Glycosyltransferase family 4 protein n=1 Tax=Eiseniibacteriota bacterium TaxID=2212470 RepID=A0A849SI72_UNCEI|nr:glycosyltransferase family 4 protein [Candidatus Eisenbacteria bacterium]